MKEVTRIFSVAIATCVSALSMAQAPSAAATIKEVGHSGANYTYDVDLMNTGTTTIGTFWFAWIPGQGYLPSRPTAELSPANWTARITNGGNASDGYSIQWTTSSANFIKAGHSLDGFEFTIAADPSEIFGDSTFHSHPPVGTSFAYHGTPFSDGGTKFAAQPVPEPKSYAVLGLGFLGLIARRKRKLA